MNAQAPHEKKDRYPRQSIAPSSAAWIFISASPHEPRHLFDIVWAIDCLRARGVPDKNIFVFHDNAQAPTHLSPFNITQNIFSLADVLVEIPKLQGFEYVFLSFTGHGSSQGLHAGSEVLPPAHFVDATRKIEGLKNAVFIVCQCYGGIFDFLEAFVTPEIGILGATKLHLSASHPMPTQNVKIQDASGNNLPPWATNIFMYFFFEWLRAPIDIDGDGASTLIDGFKFAGARTNENLVDAKFYAGLDAHGKLENARQKIRDHVSGVKKLEDIDLQTQFALAEEQSKQLYLHQEPWLLHANLLRSLIIT